MKHAYAIATGLAAFMSFACGSGDDQEHTAHAPSPSATPPATAAPASTSADVSVSGTTFSPAEVRIKAGGKVRWTFASGRHNVVSGTGCSPDGKFTSGATQVSGTFDRTFDAPGTYEYYCDPHCAMGMTGKVVVE